MASLSDIEVKRELRPCLVHNNRKKTRALFHIWEQNSQVIVQSGHSECVASTVFGIVELEDGTVMRVAPYQIQFVDNKIQEYCYVPAGSSPIGKSELFAEINGHKLYVVRDEYGRIVVSDELMRELIECYKAKEQI